MTNTLELRDIDISGELDIDQELEIQLINYHNKGWIHRHEAIQAIKHLTEVFDITQQELKS